VKRDRLRLRIEHPDKADAGVHVFQHLGIHLRRRVARRDDLGDEVRSQIKISAQVHGSCDPTPSNEGKVRRSNRVRIAAQAKAGLSGEGPAQLMDHHVAAGLEREHHRDVTVLWCRRWTHRDQDALDKLVAIILAHREKLIGRYQCCLCHDPRLCPG